MKHINQIKEKLNQLTNQLKLSRNEDDLIETDLQKWKNDFATNDSTVKCTTEYFNSTKFNTFNQQNSS